MLPQSGGDKQKKTINIKICGIVPGTSGSQIIYVLPFWGGVKRERINKSPTVIRGETKGRFCKRAVLANVPLVFGVQEKIIVLFCQGSIAGKDLFEESFDRRTSARTTILETTLLRTPR